MKTINDYVFFHEDNYRQIELLPSQNLMANRNKIDDIKAFGEDHLATGGFLKLFNRSQTIYPIKNLNIKKDTIEALLKDYALFFFPNVSTGYAVQRISKKDIHGFGFENYILYFKFNVDDIITSIWIDYNVISDTLNGNPEKLKNAIVMLGSMFDLILVDWNETITIILKNKDSLVKYFDDIL